MHVHICPIDIQMPAKFHEIPSMGLQAIKETKRYGRTDGQTDAHTDARTDARTDGQRENSIPPLKLRFGGGYNYVKKKRIKKSEMTPGLCTDSVLE